MTSDHKAMLHVSSIQTSSPALRTVERQSAAVSKQPQGDRLRVTDTWKLAVRQVLADRGWSLSQLGRAIGATPAAMSQFLRTKEECAHAVPPARWQPHPRFAFAIARETDVPIPPTGSNPRIVALIEVAQMVDKDDPGLIEALTREMRGSLSKRAETARASRAMIRGIVETGSHGTEGRAGPGRKPAK